MIMGGDKEREKSKDQTTSTGRQLNSSSAGTVGLWFLLDELGAFGQQDTGLSQPQGLWEPRSHGKVGPAHLGAKQSGGPRPWEGFWGREKRLWTVGGTKHLVLGKSISWAALEAGLRGPGLGRGGPCSELAPRVSPKATAGPLAGLPTGDSGSGEV